MGPDKNEALFGIVSEGLDEQLADEAARRAMLAGTLEDLSAAFGEHGAAPQLATEPTLPFKLYALAAIQRTNLGVAGSNPADGVRYNHSTVEVRAVAAPPHDSYHSSSANNTVHTRALMLELGSGNEDGEANEVELFGLNMYVKDIDPDLVDPFGESQALTSTGSGLIVVGDRGRTKGKESHIAGDTSVIAVRNKQTGDAKVYALTMVSDEWLDRHLDDAEFIHSVRAGMPVIRGNEAYIQLPTGQIQLVTVLSGEARAQAAEEFRVATHALKLASGPRLSDAERGIALAALRPATTDKKEP